MTNFMKKLFSAIKSRKKDDKGGTAIEYILIAVIIGVGLIAGFTSLKSTLQGKVSLINSNISTSVVAT